MYIIEIFSLQQQVAIAILHYKGTLLRVDQQLIKVLQKSFSQR